MGSVGAPHFFVDRSLGSRRLPALLRADGWALTTLDEHFGDRGPHVTDVEWLKLCAERGWPALAKDGKIRYRTGERQALVNGGVRAFLLSHGNIGFAEMAAVFIRHRNAIWTAAAEPGPAMFAVTRGEVRELQR